MVFRAISHYQILEIRAARKRRYFNPSTVEKHTKIDLHTK